MRIVSRKEWGARSPEGRRYTTTWAKRTEFVVHHSEGPTGQSVRSIQNFHMDVRKWADIGYSFLVRDDGTIYEGRGWLVVGAHAQGHNTSGIGVCYIGQNKPTDAAKNSIRALYDHACAQTGRKLPKHYHGMLSGNSTDCPGPALIAWVKAGMPGKTTPEPTPVPGTTPPPFPGRILMVRTPEIHGSDVHAWQGRMFERGWNLTVDGYYGEESEITCRAFQQEKHLMVDGKVGKDTWKATWAKPIT